jgi:signal peptidase
VNPAAVVRRVAGMACRTALVALVATFVLVAVGPRTGRYQVLTVLSDSMAPTMPRGALVLSVPVEPADIAAGDVITMRSPIGAHAVVTHRVVELVEPGAHPVVKTRGDANDPWLARLDGDRAWRVAGSVPRAGFAVLALRQAAPRLALTVLAPLALAALWLLRIWAPAGGPEHPTAELPDAPVAG